MFKIVNRERKKQTGQWSCWYPVFCLFSSASLLGLYFLLCLPGPQGDYGARPACLCWQGPLEWWERARTETSMNPPLVQARPSVCTHVFFFFMLVEDPRLRVQLFDPGSSADPGPPCYQTSGQASQSIPWSLGAHGSIFGTSAWPLFVVWGQGGGKEQLFPVSRPTLSSF